MAPKGDPRLRHRPPPLRTINVTVLQSGIADPFSIVEQTTWNEGTWSKIDEGNHALTLKGTDASGMLRFKSSGEDSQFEEFFLVALGVDTSKPWRWCDLKVDADNTETGALIHRNYHTVGTDEYSMKNEHNGSVSLTSARKTEITVEYYTDKQEDEDGILRGVRITIT